MEEWKKHGSSKGGSMVEICKNFKNKNSNKRTTLQTQNPKKKPFWDLLQEVNKNRGWQLQARALLLFIHILQTWHLSIVLADSCPDWFIYSLYSLIKRHYYFLSRATSLSCLLILIFVLSHGIVYLTPCRWVDSYPPTAKVQQMTC